MSELSCTNLSKQYDDKLDVDGIDINLQTKQVIGLLGPNGAGKTTTFFMIVGLIHCNNGQIKINDYDITSVPMHIRSNMGISYLPQEASIFRNLSARDNILAILETLGFASVSAQSYQVLFKKHDFRLFYIRI